MPIPVPYAAWRVTLEDQDLTDKLSPLLLSLSLSERRDEEADKIELTLDDSSGLIALPPLGARLRVFMGWSKGQNMPLGLYDKGSFKVDAARISGGPDIITLSACSADFSQGFRKRRNRSFVGKTIDHVIKAIAADNGLKAVVHADLKSEVIPALGFGPKSDAALLRALGNMYDATATVKDKNLLFSPINSGQSAGGQALKIENIDRTMTAPNYEFETAARDHYSGVEAEWHSKSSATRHTIVVGDETNAKRLKKIYASEKSARTAAEAEFKRLKRAKATLSISLIYGRPDLFPDIPITVTGFKSEINAIDWVIKDADHTQNGTGGSLTRLTLETRS